MRTYSSILSQITNGTFCNQSCYSSLLHICTSSIDNQKETINNLWSPNELLSMGE